MDNGKRIDRREFNLHSAMVILGGVAITVSGCSSDSPTAPTPPPTPTDVNGTVGTNHGHTAVVTSAQLTAGNMISLDITGGSSHPHTVELSAAEVGQRVKPIPSWNSSRLLIAYAAFFFNVVVSIFSCRFNASRSLGRCR